MPHQQSSFPVLNKITSPQVFYFLCLIFVGGLVFSRALLNLVPILMVLLAFSRGTFDENLKALKNNTPALLLLAIYGLFLISFVYTEDTAKWLWFSTRYMPLLLLPLAFGVMPVLSNKQVNNILFTFSLLTTVITVGTLIKYFLNYEAYNQAISQSDSLQPVLGIFHIYFGLMMALAIIFCLDIYKKPHFIGHPPLRYMALFCIVLNFIALHILAYRTGLLALYVALLWQVVFFIRTKKKYLMGLGLLVLIMGTPVIAFYSLESVQRRVENTKTDISRYVEHQDINHYSIAQRFAAWETGLAVFKSHWLLGVGLADVNNEIRRQYNIKDFGLIKENQVGIHNQYLQIAVGLGLVGLLVFLAGLIYPFLKQTWQNDTLTKSFIICIAVAMFVENFSQRQLGLNLYVFFYGLLVIMKQKRMPEEKTPDKALTKLSA